MHPDKGGNHQDYIELVNAYREIERHRKKEKDNSTDIHQIFTSDDLSSRFQKSSEPHISELTYVHRYEKDEYVFIEEVTFHEDNSTSSIIIDKFIK